MTISDTGDLWWIFLADKGTKQLGHLQRQIYPKRTITIPKKNWALQKRALPQIHLIVIVPMVFFLNNYNMHTPNRNTAIRAIFCGALLNTLTKTLRDVWKLDLPSDIIQAQTAQTQMGNGLSIDPIFLKGCKWSSRHKLPAHPQQKKRKSWKVGLWPLSFNWSNTKKNTVTYIYIYICTIIQWLIFWVSDCLSVFRFSTSISPILCRVHQALGVPICFGWG